MTAEEHNKTLGTLYFVYGGVHGLTLVALLLLVFIARLTTPLAELIASSWMVVGFIIFVILLLVVGLLPLLVGYGLRKRSGWVRLLALALAVVSLLNIPIGTALGIYTIKFLKSDGGVKFYGGLASTASENELQEAMNGARPLINLAERLKQ